MRWSIRNQIFVPLATIVLTAIVVLAATASWLAARHSEKQTVTQLKSVIETLSTANFPYTKSVLKKMQGLSGAHFVALNQQDEILTTTLPAAESSREWISQVPLMQEINSLGRDPSVQIGNSKYFTARLQTISPIWNTSLLILYPEKNWREAQWSAAWPPLAVGAVTLFVMVLVSAGQAHRLSRRIQTVRQLFSRIAEGHFERAPIRAPNDELADLIKSANRLSDQLQQMQETIRHTERLRLLAQLAGGLAHQLRNEITGARMAVQLHNRRCTHHDSDESLNVALRQLALTEAHIKGLLSLGRRERTAPTPGDLQTLLDEVKGMIQPSCSHARVQLKMSIELEQNSAIVANADAVRVALLNLMLNAVEAAGTGGTVCLTATSDNGLLCVEVVDTGLGPPEQLQETLFEPFVTSKPEGIGLGLAVARQTAIDQDGSLDWKRDRDRTVFTLMLPTLRVEPSTVSLPDVEQETEVII